MQAIRNATIGSDIECFLADKESGMIVSAEPFIQGTKDNPAVFKDKWFTTQLDNVLAEFTIPPANKKEEFVNNILFAQDYLTSIIPANLRTAFIPANIMEDRYIATEHAQTFGCNPSKSAWTDQNVQIMRDIIPNLRSAGLHVHVGYDSPSDMISMILIKSMDLYLGVASVLIEPDNQRRLLYGKAGEFRIKPYGTEYRTLSSYFASSPELLAWVFEGTQAAINFVNTSSHGLSEETGLMIQDCINNSNKQIARRLVEQYKIILP